MEQSVVDRLENNRYALSQSFERLKLAIKNRDENSIYAGIGETLLWCITTDEWHIEHNEWYEDRKDNCENGLILYGLKHAYNSVKHNMDFVKIHIRKGGLSFPVAFPIKFPPITVHWMKAGEILTGRYKSQKVNYEKYIEEKDVINTFNNAFLFLDEEYQRVITKFRR